MYDFTQPNILSLVSHLQNYNQARLNVELNINIQDVNDNRPFVDPSDGTTVTENSRAHTLIATIKAIDRDASPEFRNVSKSAIS